MPLLEVHVFHRCVIAVIGVLATGTAAAGGPIKLDAKAPSFEVAELRAMDQKELRALFFRGGGARNAAASCADCVAADSRLRALDRDGKSADYPPGCSRSPRPTGRRSVRPHAFRICLPDLRSGRTSLAPFHCRVAKEHRPSLSSRLLQCRNRTPSRSSAQAWLEHGCCAGGAFPGRCSQNDFTLVDRAPPKRNKIRSD